MLNIGRNMHFRSNEVPTKVIDNPEAIRTRNGCNGISNDRKTLTWSTLCNRGIQGSTSCINQFTACFINRSHECHVAGIPIEPALVTSDVKVHYIAGLQGSSIRNPMCNHFVHCRADTLREPHEPNAAWKCTSRDNVLRYISIDLLGCNARQSEPSCKLKRRGCYLSSSTNEFDLVGLYARSELRYSFSWGPWNNRWYQVRLAESMSTINHSLFKYPPHLFAWNFFTHHTEPNR